ncbi:MAG TPA: DinB family protein [Luteitalea sp.]|nr:DinB family protein [Luteitalea sp.]
MSDTGAAQLDGIRAALLACDDRAARLAASATPAAWQARPPTGGWCASECLQHLVLSADAMLLRIDAALAAAPAPARAHDAAYRTGFLARVLIWSLEPPYRMKSKTGAAFAPAQAHTAADDVAALREAHDRVRASLERARGRDLESLVIASPFAERVRYNVYAALAILPVHARRHLWQAEQTLARLQVG